MEVSAKENKDKCVQKAFQQMMEEILKVQMKIEEKRSKSNIKNLKSRKNKNKIRKKKSGCC